MTPTMLEAIDAFKSTYAHGLAERPEDLRSIDELDQMLHEARAVIGRSAMRTSIEAVRVRALVDVPSCCGRSMRKDHRPKLRVLSMQRRA